MKGLMSMQHRTLWRRLLVVALVLTLVGAACGDDDDDAGSGDKGGSTKEDSGSDKTLGGMRGTTPLVDLGDEFKDRLLETDSALQDFNYAAESYDAAIVIALAVLQAKTDGLAYANEINGITREGEKCTDFKACADLIAAGTDIDYDGQSGPLEFSGNGEPTEASYGVLEFGDDNKLDDAKTEYKVATAPAEADVDQIPATGTRAGDGTLTIGTLLPQTGSLAFLGPPEFAGVDLAVAEINENGGVLGKPIVSIEGDSGDTESNIANTTVDTQLNQNVDAIIGAASSSVSLSVVDKIVNAGVVMFSPANTSKKLSTYDDKGLYFRDAPSDILQGQVLGEVIAADNITTVGILALDDDYGTGLAEDLKASLEEAGIEVGDPVIYDPKAQTFDSEVGDMKAADPEAIVVIGFDESSRVLTEMVAQGVGPSSKAVYGVDGNMGNALGENFSAGK
jgi:ABC-type branched-subunit amino acid transport system substrate-binding protein